MNLFLRVSLALSMLLAFEAALACAQEKKPARELSRDDLFGSDKLWNAHLTIGAKEFDAMQPKGGGMFFMGFPKKGEIPPKKIDVPKKAEPANTDAHKNKGFGIEFPYAKGNIEFAGKLVTEVGIRYKGNSTYTMSASGLKRPFKIDVNHYHDEQHLHGLKGLYLGNGVADSTRIREALAFAVFRAANVPAPRTAFVKLYLTVPAKHDKTYIGLYTLIEPVDKTFLKKHFRSDKGMLLKPEKIQGLPYLGENWSSYSMKYNPKREPTDAQKRRLMEFTKLINLADDAAFAQKIEGFLNVDGFLRFAAANSLIANLDSFFGLGHNYFAYLNPKTNQFHFMPWDVDLSFGGFSFAGGGQAEWAVAQPYTGKNKLTERVLAIKKYNDAYRGHMRSLAENDFSPKAMRAKIAVLEATVKDAIAKEPANKGGFAGFPGFGGKKQTLDEFVTQRAESVVAQLDGKSQGKILVGMGFGGGKGGKGFGFGPGNLLAKPIIDVVDTDKNGKISAGEFNVAAAKLFKEAGGDPKTPVEEEKLIDTINRLTPVPAAFAGLKLPPLPKGFGIGKSMAGALLKFTVTDKDKKITQEQWMAGADKLFRQWDKTKSGSIDETRLREALDEFLPPRQIGPGPNFGPGAGDPKKNAPAKQPQKEKGT